MPCGGVSRYLINGFVPSGKLYEFRCECGHETSIDSIGRVFWMLVFSVFFAACFLASWSDGGIFPWVVVFFAVFTIGCFGHEVYKRARAPEIS